MNMLSCSFRRTIACACVFLKKMFCLVCFSLRKCGHPKRNSNLNQVPPKFILLVVDLFEGIYLATKNTDKDLTNMTHTIHGTGIFP